MKKSSEIVIRFISSVSLGLLFVVFFLYGFQFLRCFHEATIIPQIRSYPVMHIQFYGSGADTVSARFSFCDTAGKEFAVIDRSWNGSYLNVAFSSARFSGKEIMFPYRIYPVSQSQSLQGKEGTRLADYYMEYKKCLLLGEPCTDRQKKALYHLGVFALMQTSKFQSSFSRIYTVNLSECRMGESYDINTDSNGLLILSHS